MSRTLTVVGVATIAVLSAVAASQAQAPQNPQRGGDHFECGPPLLAGLAGWADAGSHCADST